MTLANDVDYSYILIIVAHSVECILRDYYRISTDIKTVSLGVCCTQYCFIAFGPVESIAWLIKYAYSAGVVSITRALCT